MEVLRVAQNDKATIKKVAEIHLQTFQGFFLSSLGKGFLRLMYSCYTKFDKADLLVAKEGDNILGFCAFSFAMSDFYKYMLKSKFFAFSWYAFFAFLKSPKKFFRLFGALLKPRDAKREEKYVELASIGVAPQYKKMGVGSTLIGKVKSLVDFNEYAYITLETDAENNQIANAFYQKNGFVLARIFEQRKGRMMNEYRYRDENIGA